jgi:hypothetical protein
MKKAVDSSCLFRFPLNQLINHQPTNQSINPFIHQSTHLSGVP